MAIGSTRPPALRLNQRSRLQFFYETSSEEPYNFWSYDAHIDDSDNNKGFAYLP